MAANFLTCETQAGLMDIYVASPETTERCPVVIVLQEAFGINAHIRGICERLAAEGFLAAAPDLFYRNGRRIVVEYGDRKEMMPLLGQMTNKDIISDIRYAINFLDNLPTADCNKVSTLGFCVGGFSSALCATSLSLKKMISFYGGGMVHTREGIGLDPILPKFSLIKCPTLFFFGGIDASIPEQDIEAIKQKLKDSKVNHKVIVYPEADHGFFCDERKTYNPDAAKDAWEKSLIFLRD